MEYAKHLALAFAAIALVGCAAPAPEPIMPEPVYDKFGNAEYSGQVCVPAGQTRLTAAQQQLPTCESRCAPGTQLDGRQSAATHAVSREPICVPIRTNQGSGDRQSQPSDPGRDPTGGGGQTAVRG